MTRIVAGRRAVLEALRGRGEVSAVYLAEGEEAAFRDIAEAARHRDVRTENRTQADLDGLSAGVRHQGVLAIVGAYAYVSLEQILEQAADPPLIVCLDEITDPHNFGAIVRSAVAFGCDGVVTLLHRAAPVTPVVVRASAGATEHARIARVSNLAKALAVLSEHGLSIVGLDAAGEVDVGALAPAPQGRAVVIGSEGRGLRRLVRERCDVLARIEMAGTIGSLNASVAAGIALRACFRDRAARV